MKASLIAVILLSFALVTGCERDATTTTDAGERPAASASVEMTPEQLGELGAEIERNPDRADELLNQRGLDERSFEQKIREITEEPEASQRYAAAYERARDVG